MVARRNLLEQHVQLGRHCAREHGALAKARRGLQQVFQLSLIPHVNEAIRFVQHNVAQGSQIQHASMHHVHDAAGRAAV